MIRPDVTIPFDHQQSAHCETGVISNLMRFHGLPVSEPMAFGIGSGLFYSHMPFLKMNGIPVTSYRILPGHIFKRFSRNVGVKMERASFRDHDQAMRALDDVLDQGLPVGMLTSVFYLPYLPKAFRFHFNAHNIVVGGRRGDEEGRLALQAGFTDFDELAVVEGLGLERLNLGVDEGHGVFSLVEVEDNG